KKDSLPYAAFSRWQLDLSRDVLGYHLLYWKRKLRGNLPALILPAYRRDAIHVYDEERGYFSIGKELTSRILSYTKTKGISVSVFMLSAFKALLYRYSGQEDLIVGIWGDNRETQANIRDTIGPVTNLLPIRTTVESGTTFSQLLHEVNQSGLEAREYHHIPFDRLVAELNLQKDMSRTALFDVLFHYEDHPVEISGGADLSIRVIETNLGWGKYDFNLFLQRNEDIISGILTFNKLYYSAETISSFTGHLQYLLDNILKDDQRPLLDMPLLSASEREELLSSFSHGAVTEYGDE
ncbi:condensation domain-containing protein, partial [Mucilaginibacter sp. RCC_168]|uniref:condensation domain-containing protein n=1 Tax=Mucilaginibacter sp. RCC_168 TaxID=3239221 RepID=UPI003526AA99